MMNKHPFQRLLGVLICFGMLCSFALPSVAYAEDTAETQTGSLCITQTIDENGQTLPDGIQLVAEFTLTDADGNKLTGTYPVTFSGSTASGNTDIGELNGWMFSNSESRTIGNLPAGTKYTVTETSAYADVVVANGSGEIAAGQTSTVTVSATLKDMSSTGGLILTQTVKNANSESDTSGVTISSQITFKKDGSLYEPTSPYFVKWSDGSFYNSFSSSMYVDLSNGESVTFDGLPQGVTYEIAQSTSIASCSIDSSSGTIAAGENSTATATAVLKDLSNTASLTITHTVDENLKTDEDAGIAWIQFKDSLGNPISESYLCTFTSSDDSAYEMEIEGYNFRDEVIRYTLDVGTYKSITFKYLPIGTTYEISHSNATTDASFSPAASGTIKAGGSAVDITCTSKDVSNVGSILITQNIIKSDETSFSYGNYAPTLVLTDENGNALTDVTYAVKYGSSSQKYSWSESETSLWLEGTDDNPNFVEISYLPAGTKYKVELATADGVTTISNGEGTVVAGQTQEVTITTDLTVHTHTWSSDWAKDDTAHWHECTKANCTVTDNSEKDSYAAHTWDEGVQNGNEVIYTCLVCQATRSGVLKNVEADGNVVTQVRIKPDTPETTLNTSVKEITADEKILSADEKAQIEAGSTARIWLDVSVEPSVSEAESTATETEAAAVLGAGADIRYFDISLYKQINNNTPAAITETTNALSITIDIPADLPAVADGMVRSYAIIRYHDGKAETLPTTVSGNSLTFSTNLFSTYAIAYKDSPKPAEVSTSASTTSTAVIPKTGDAGEPVLWGVAGAAALLGLGVTVSAKRRREDKE